MRRPMVVFAACALASAAHAQRPQLSRVVRQYVSVDTPLVAVTNVTLIDGTGAPARRGQTVLIRDGRFEAVGETGRVPVPAGAVVIDGTGHTAIPALVGLHDHLYYTAAGGRLVLWERRRFDWLLPPERN